MMEPNREGQVLAGKYRLKKVLARGGMGRVYLAEDLHLHKVWAVKEMEGELMGSYEAVQNEAALLGNRSHPGLPVVVDLFADGGFFYLVMEFVEGQTLEEAVLRQGAFPEESCADVLRQLIEILSYLHNQHPAVCYLDMKPANVLLTPAGKVMLVDFGAAMETEGAACRRGGFFGTYGYAPPEQCGELRSRRDRTAGKALRRDTVCDVRSDVYALGATVYFLLTGYDPARPPFGIRPWKEWEGAAGTDFIALLQRCLEREPDRRFQSMEELRTALADCRIGKQKMKERIRQKLPWRRNFVLRQEKSVFLTEKRQSGLFGS